MVTEKTKGGTGCSGLRGSRQCICSLFQLPRGGGDFAGGRQIVTGVNVENASYGLSNCAERTAVFKAVTDGYTEILAVAVCTENGGSPCGACRQVLVEFAGDIPVLLSDAAGEVRETTLYALLPAPLWP